MSCVMQQKDCKHWFAELSVDMDKVLFVLLNYVHMHRKLAKPQQGWALESSVYGSVDTEMMSDAKLQDSPWNVVYGSCCLRKANTKILLNSCIFWFTCFPDTWNYKAHFEFVRLVEKLWWKERNQFNTSKNAKTENCSFEVSEQFYTDLERFLGRAAKSTCRRPCCGRRHPTRQDNFTSLHLCYCGCDGLNNILNWHPPPSFVRGQTQRLLLGFVCDSALLCQRGTSGASVCGIRQNSARIWTLSELLVICQM